MQGLTKFIVFVLPFSLRNFYVTPAVEMYKAYIQLRHLLIARHFKQFFGAHVLLLFIIGQGTFEQQ